MVELVRSGQSPEALAKEFEPSAPTIRSWAKQADLGRGAAHGRHHERRPRRAAPRWLKREAKRLRIGRDILSALGPQAGRPKWPRPGSRCKRSTGCHESARVTANLRPRRYTPPGWYKRHLPRTTFRYPLMLTARELCSHLNPPTDVLVTITGNPVIQWFVN